MRCDVAAAHSKAGFPLFDREGDRRCCSAADISNPETYEAALPTSFALPTSTCEVRTCGSTSRSEEHTSELQSLMRISYAVFCLKKKNKQKTNMIKKKTNLNTQIIHIT